MVALQRLGGRREGGLSGRPASGSSPSTKPPRLADIHPEFPRNAARVLELHRLAMAKGLVGSSEAARLKFRTAAEHAREEPANRRLRRHLHGGPCVGSILPAVRLRPTPPSADALLVPSVHAAVAHAGGHADPFPLVHAEYVS